MQSPRRCEDRMYLCHACHPDGFCSLILLLFFICFYLAAGHAHEYECGSPRVNKFDSIKFTHCGNINKI